MHNEIKLEKYKKKEYNKVCEFIHSVIKHILKDPYKCKECGYEEKVPDFVAFECYSEEDFDKESGSPIVLCQECDADMIIKK